MRLEPLSEAIKHSSGRQPARKPLKLKSLKLSTKPPADPLALTHAAAVGEIRRRSERGE